MVSKGRRRGVDWMMGVWVRPDLERKSSVDRDKYCSRMTGERIKERRIKLQYVRTETGIWEGGRTRLRGVLHVETPHPDLI